MKDIANPTFAFIAQLVSSLAWPIALLACVLLLRHHLKSLLPLIRSVKYSDVEIKFGKDVADLAKTAQSTSLPEKPSESLTREWSDITGIASVRPRTAIRSAFRKLEDLMFETARAKNVEIADGAFGMPMVIGALLLKGGIIDTEQYDLLFRLRGLLNEAEQAPPDSISIESALQFVNLAQRLATAVQS
jgi:hypothetical protein